ncbi:hypothetical protein BN873_360052 [Candidatus Competibacter denitrificans Run_A_D11]|uniref:Uncharacterized protein n=1 Tax=Candidatus Competibacter denitrificans Run_A_D11 TaxID=1400863 RepID=W6MDJ2_9GAMM|nr:hypothetical protein BN873_360052 [Candidatus Competibacter denitrificans Run_A_D11]
MSWSLAFFPDVFAVAPVLVAVALVPVVEMVVMEGVSDCG